MTISPPQTTNGVPHDGTLTAFRAFLEAERPALAAALLRELVDHAPHYHTMSDEQRVQRINDNIDTYLAGLDDPEQLTRLSEQQLGPVVAHQVDLDTALRLTWIYRQHFVNISLRAMQAGVDGAADGLQALMGLIDRRAQILVQFYQERLKLFEILVENALDGISVTDLRGRCTYLNAANLRILGYSDLSQVIGLDSSKLLAPEEAERITNEIVPQVMCDGAWQGQLWGLRADGSRFQMQNTLVLLKDMHSQPAAIASFMRNITSEHEAEHELKRLYEETQRQADALRTFFALAENAPDGVVVADSAGVVSYANLAMRTLLGNQESMVGTPIAEQLAEPQEQIDEIGQQIATHGSWSGVLAYRRRNGSIVQCHGSSFLIESSDDAPGVTASIVRDLTEQQHAEQERLALQEQVIAVQQAALRELSTPLIPIAKGVVAMPLIGSIDSARAQQVVEGLLHGVSVNRAQTAIIDITGVLVVDTQVAGALVRAAQAVELLGARVVLTGIRPEVAQTLVGIGVNLGSIVTRATLQDGINYAIGQDKR